MRIVRKTSGRKSIYPSSRLAVPRFCAAGIPAKSRIHKEKVETSWQIRHPGNHPYLCRAVNDKGAFISGVYGWVDAVDVSAVEAVKSTIPTPAPATPAKLATAVIDVGDVVKITGTKYYSGVNIPAWVKIKNWIVLEAKGDRVVVDKSADGKNAICSPIKRSDLQLVKKK